MSKPHTITQEEADDLRKAITAITSSFTWSQTEEGHDFWSEVVESLTRKAHHKTSDGYPQTSEKTPKKIIHLDGVPHEVPDGWQWCLDNQDTPEEIAEEALRKAFTQTPTEKQ